MCSDRRYPCIDSSPLNDLTEVYDAILNHKSSTDILPSESPTIRRLPYEKHSNDALKQTCSRPQPVFNQNIRIAVVENAKRF